MSEHSLVAVVGLGEVGRPLLNILSKSFDCVGIDVDPVDLGCSCSVLHVCYPFEIGDFVGTTVGYVKKYQPALTVIHSTVAPGTTRRVQNALPSCPLAYSPVRGKHARMEGELMRYSKFVAAFRVDALQRASEHFRSAGFTVCTVRTPEIAELSKLLETTYLGVLVAWTQEMERLAGQVGGNFDEVNAFITEIDFLPSHIFPGHIGGHCVMPNIAILQSQYQSPFFDAVQESNRSKERLPSLAAR